MDTRTLIYKYIQGANFITFKIGRLLAVVPFGKLQFIAGLKIPEKIHSTNICYSGRTGKAINWCYKDQLTPQDEWRDDNAAPAAITPECDNRNKYDKTDTSSRKWQRSPIWHLLADHKRPIFYFWLYIKHMTLVYHNTGSYECHFVTCIFWEWLLRMRC